MRFFDRENEIAELRRIREVSQETARFTVLTGRRRVGKTELIARALGDQPFVYFSEIARDWDALHTRSKLNVVVSGSVNRLMTKIFEDREAPLYGRNTGKLHLDPFSVPALKEILGFYNPQYTKDDLLALWTFIGGVARYVALLMDAGAVTKEGMIAEVIRPNSCFFDEGKVVLMEEFGKEYANYFSILSAIAEGRTSRDRIEQDIGGDAGGFLTRLERHYAMIG